MNRSTALEVTMKNPSKRLCLLCLVCWAVNAIGGMSETEEFRQLHRDIVLLNLVNGLYLSTQQIEDLLEKIQEARQIREDCTNKAEQRKDELGEVFEELKTVLQENQEVPDDLKKRVHRAEETLHRLKDDLAENLKRLESDVEAILTKNQRVVIDTYQPCMIPPSQGKIGQSVETAAEGIVRMLTRVRNMPRDRYDLVKDMLVDFQIDKTERHLGVLTEDEKQQIRQETLTIFEQVRRMSDQDFIVQKGELARRFIREPDDARRPRKHELGRAGRFLLDPRLEPILRMRLEQTKQG